MYRTINMKIFSKIVFIFLSICCVPLMFNFKSTANKEERDIPIVVCTDDNYVYPAIVTLTSLLENADKDTFYKIYVLTPERILEENLNKLLKIENNYKNCCITIHKLGNDYDQYKNYSYFTKAIFYRLKISSILGNEVKCIYVDTDTIILKDLAELYSIDISDYYVAGVSDGTGVIYENEFKEKLNMPNDVIKNYINSGVLLLNLEKIRKDKMELKFDDFIKEKVFKEGISVFGDQDCINLVCAGKILNLPLKYNLTLVIRPTLEYDNNYLAKSYFSKEQWNDALRAPVIVHYTSNRKPWNCLKLYRIELWWEYANKSVFAEEIRNKYYRYKR